MMSKRDSLPSSSSSSSFSTHQWKYDVFLSFRGVDTRYNFTDHLYVALKEKGICTFRDSENLEKGKFIRELFEAIEQSRFVIVVFSKNYAFSTWCLDELVKIVKCKEEMGLTVLPIFYDVDPTDVRKQTGPFEKAFADYKERLKNYTEKVDPWREALKKVGDISGWHPKNWYESAFIQHIVKEIMDRQNSKFSRVTKNIVGIESALEKLIPSYLDFGNDVCMIGICGMGGLGKTTLARVIYDKYVQQFEGSSFILNVRERSEKGDLLGLQQQVLEEILGESNTKIWDVRRGVDIIKNMLFRKRILLVLDDVSHVDQLEKLVGEDDWFGSGSWIIITTRDEQVLVHREGLKIYKHNLLNDDDALKLLSLKAFKNEQPKDGYMDLSKEVVKYASGLPLAVVTLGSFLIGRTINEWKSALKSFKKNKGEIFNILKISYDGLEKMWQEIFLDIACFFTGDKKDRVIQILESCGFDATIGVSVLLEKSLLTIDGEKLGMHDLLKEMGEKIVRLGSKGNLGRQSRLWLIKDLHSVLAKDMATEEIQAVLVKFGATKSFNFEEFTKVFTKMSKLRLLIIVGNNIWNVLNHVSNNLRHLTWISCPLKCIPLSFQSMELVQLDLSYSGLKYLWEGVKVFGKLKFIDLKHSCLIRTPDFSGVPRLKRLRLSWCMELVEIHPSVGQLSRLNELHLDHCSALTNLPIMSAEMKSLTLLRLDCCQNFRKFPEFKGIMKSLSKLYLGGTAIKNLAPSSIECLSALTLLDLSLCTNLEYLPSNINSLRSLEVLDLSGCYRLHSVPELPSSMRNVNANECPSLEPLAATKIFGRYLQGLFRPKTKYETSPIRKKDGPRTELFQVITSVSRKLAMDAKFCEGNSVRIDRPLNWFNDDSWMGFTVGTKLTDSWMGAYNLRARVIIHGGESGDTPQSHDASEMSIKSREYGCQRSSFWLLYLPRDYWHATFGNGECRRIEFIFEISNPQIKITEQTCTFSSLYHEVNFSLNQAIDSSEQLQCSPYYYYEDEFRRAELQIGLNALSHVHGDLRHLTWARFPLEYFPSSFQPNELVQLDLPGSKLKCFWDGGKIFDKLKFIDLSYSQFIRTPDFSGFPRLESLRLSQCRELVEIHPSVGQLSRLNELHLDYCILLRSVPELPSSTRSVNAIECRSLEPLAATKILCSYLQGLIRPETEYETSPVRKKDGPQTKLFQIITSELNFIEPWSLLLDGKFCKGNSISVDLPPNWCNGRWMGFTLCADFSEGERTFDLRARVIALGGESGDTPRGHYLFEMSVEHSRDQCSSTVNWLWYMPCDHWFATVGNDECSRIEFTFETSDPRIEVNACAVSLIYEEVKFGTTLNQAMLQYWGSYKPLIDQSPLSTCGGGPQGPGTHECPFNPPTSWST